MLKGEHGAIRAEFLGFGVHHGTSEALAIHGTFEDADVEDEHVTWELFGKDVRELLQERVMHVLIFISSRRASTV